MALVMRITASEEIYQKLRNEILSLRFEPGQELNLQLLATQLQVSRSPVRDALMKLSGDNLVDIFPQRGTRVSCIDLKQVEEERFLRKSLEQSAVRKFVPIAKCKELGQMEDAITLQQRAMVSKDFNQFLEADDTFHAAIFSGIDMDRIWNLICSQGGNHHRIRLLSFAEKDVLGNIIEQHRAMLDAIKQKDLETVLAIEHRHLDKLLEETEFMIKRHPFYFKKIQATEGLIPKN
ncbi:GntR family transcriptional regulator [uncultured Sphaerochaeta sp.]|uniref:GntR family transcriptional regulator n=1 Tax=uncultured Sphaerochaeta sp. TaxID=886478 RepID=UPI002A0A3AC9|nr:GntR family transcriptional regulator [uncultured Sphaerochaeta sp.]